ncbi:MAG: DUF1292 domain-containing protein [Defluviitaleaceae bacterium]|nr:DUF1292 domain-containing protein [Defluviitaleaceae bacterium]
MNNEEHEKHDEYCTCGCNEHSYEEVLTIIDENGNKTDCYPLGVFDMDEKEYIALAYNIDTDDEDMFIFRYLENEEGIELDNIDNEEEYAKAYELFNKIMEEAIEEFGDELL